MKKNKKSIYDKLVYDVYKYASESFKLYIRENNKYNLLNIDNSQLQDWGYLVLTKGENELLKDIKRYFRKYTKFRNKVNCFNFGIRVKDSDNDYIHLPNTTVEQYNIKEHLREYKLLKQVLKENNYKNPVTIKKATLDGNMNVIKSIEKDDKLKLLNRVYLRAV